MTSWNSRETVDLVLAAKDNFPEAWDALYKRCAEDMRKFCRRFLGRRDRLRRLYETEDILHEAFVTAIQQIRKLENDAAFYAWIRTIIRRTVTLKRRDSLRDSGGQDAPDVVSLDSYEKELSLADDAARILDAVLQLFPQHPEAMAIFSYLQFEEGFTPDGLSETLGVSRRTVYRRMEEAARLLRKHLEE